MPVVLVPLIEVASLVMAPLMTELVSVGAVVNRDLVGRAAERLAAAGGEGDDTAGGARQAGEGEGRRAAAARRGLQGRVAGVDRQGAEGLCRGGSRAPRSLNVPPASVQRRRGVDAVQHVGAGPGVVQGERRPGLTVMAVVPSRVPPASRQRALVDGRRAGVDRRASRASVPVPRVGVDLRDDRGRPPLEAAGCCSSGCSR